jgi:hypothetical protein
MFKVHAIREQDLDKYLALGWVKGTTRLVFSDKVVVVTVRWLHKESWPKFPSEQDKKRHILTLDLKTGEYTDGR